MGCIVCPKCGLTNPATTMHCKCGYYFASPAETERRWDELTGAADASNVDKTSNGSKRSQQTAILVVVAIAAVIAAASNPDKRAFTDCITESAFDSKEVGGLLGRQIATLFVDNMVRRSNYVFFSIFTCATPDGRENSFYGAFGNIWGLPSNGPESTSVRRHGAEAPGPTTVRPTAASPARPGEPVRVGASLWRITSVVDEGTVLESNNMFQEDARAQGTRFVRVRGVVTNLDLDEHSAMVRTKVVDQKGRKYSPPSSSGFYVTRGKALSFGNKLRPDIPFTFEQVYEVAPDSRVVAIEVEDAGAAMGVKGLIRVE